MDELLEKLQTNTAEQPYVIESVDCGRFVAPVATSVEKSKYLCVRGNKGNNEQYFLDYIEIS